jgi:Domain of unknown function (DUF6265)
MPGGPSAFVLAVLVVASPVLAAPQEASKSAATLSDLAWISGQWLSAGPDRSEEVWSPPSGDSMIGMWRLVAGGSTRVYELLAITREAEGPVYWLRHFDRQFVGWEEKDAPIRLVLMRSATGEAVFEGPGSDGVMVRLTYRQPSPDTLTVRLEHGEEESLFEFRRAARLR